MYKIISLSKRTQIRKLKPRVAWAAHSAIDVFRKNEGPHKKYMLTSPSRHIRRSITNTLPGHQLPEDIKATSYLTAITNRCKPSYFSWLAQAVDNIATKISVIEVVVAVIDFLFLSSLHVSESHNSNFALKKIQRNETLAPADAKQNLKEPSGVEIGAKTVATDMEYVRGYAMVGSGAMGTVISTVSTLKLRTINQGVEQYFDQYDKRDSSYTIERKISKRNSRVQSRCKFNCPIWLKPVISLVLRAFSFGITESLDEEAVPFKKKMPVMFGLINLYLLKQVMSDFDRELKQLLFWKGEIEKLVRVKKIY